MKELSIVGKSAKRVDTSAKATGEALFTADLSLPRMLVGKVKRSPYAHARILSVDTSRAEQLPGVRAVVTSQDSTGEKWGVFRYTQDQAFLPSDKVRFIGEEVAAVAAVDEDTALHALDLITAEYEELPAVFTMDEATKPGAVLIHESNPGNVNVHVKIDVGDVEKGFATSYYVREDTFSAPEESYFQAEPYAVVAQFDNSGNLDIWMPNAGPHLKAKPLSNCLRMPLNKVRVRKISIGGAFGGRSEISPADVICALLARKARQPVKIAYTREENSVATRQAHSMVTTIKTGVDREGRVISRDITCRMDGGAYSSTGPIATSVPFLCMEQAYRMDNVRYNGYRVFTNKPIRGHVQDRRPGVRLRRRPPARPHRRRARHRSRDDEAQERASGRRLHADPVFRAELRHDGNDREDGRTGRMEREAGQTAAFPRYRHRMQLRADGVPHGHKGGFTAFIKFNEDGGATVISGVVDNGQGNDNMIVQIAAEELGLLPEDIQLITADTEVTPSDPALIPCARRLSAATR